MKSKGDKLHALGLNVLHKSNDEGFGAISASALKGNYISWLNSTKCDGTEHDILC